MSIYYSSEADLCLLCSQLCLLTIFCLPEKNEDWGQSEKWGEGMQRRPNLQLQGRHNWITQVKQEVCSPDQPEVHSLSEGSRYDPAPGSWAPSGVGWVGGSFLQVSLLLGWGDREGASSGCLSTASSSWPAPPPQALLRPVCFASRRPVSCPPLFPAYRVSFLDSLGCHQPAWRHRDHKTIPCGPWAVLAAPSSFRAGLTGCLVFITETFLAHSFSIPDGGMRRATKDISEFPWMCMLDEPSLLIAESCCFKERFLCSYWKPLETPQTGNGDISKSYLYMTKASCKQHTLFVWLN